MSNWKLHTPNGVNDILPDECAVKKEIEIKKEHYRLLTPYANYYKKLLQVYSSTCTEQFTEQFADQEMTGYWWSLTNIQLEEER